jgi:putative ABC transport system ATP-binding protein
VALFAFDAVTVAGAGGRPRLDAVTAELPDGGVTAVSGPSGAGKSTLLRCCNRLEAPDAGVVRYRGQDVAGRDVLAHRREVGMVFQQPVLFPGSVRDNLRVADPELDDDRAAELLEHAALDRSFLDREGGSLSGGEGQRACLARALATRPRVLLMDEPTSALDREATLLLERLMRMLVDEGVPVVLVSHDDEQRARVADAVLELRDGRVAA